jgi:hypothetical protein
LRLREICMAPTTTKIAANAYQITHHSGESIPSEMCISSLPLLDYLAKIYKLSFN